MDSFAVPVCSFAKAHRCKGFAGVASHGYDAMSKGGFYGFKAHLRVCWPGVIVEGALVPANVPDRWVIESDLSLFEQEEVAAKGGGSWLLLDTNYWSPILKEDLKRQGG